MCANPYAAFWENLLEPQQRRCPYLVRDISVDGGNENQAVEVTVWFDKIKIVYSSLTHLWTENNQDYFDSISSFPRLIVRFEDLVFHAVEVITEVCHCAGGVMKSTSNNSTFQYVVGSTKTGEHGHKIGSTGLIEAMIKYAGKDSEHRYDQMTSADFAFAKKTLASTKLMEEYGYMVV